MEIEYKYKKALEEYDLSIKQLPEDARHGIDQINQISRAIKMQEKKGNEISDKTISKIKALDKWVYYEILDYINDTDQNDDDMPTDAEEIQDDLNNQDKSEQGKPEEKPIELNPTGIKIDEELKALYDSKKTKIDVNEMEKLAPTAYDVIFDSYDPDDKENGVETSHFKLVETNPDIYTLTKK